MVNFDVTEGVIVAADDLIAPDIVAGDHRILVSHGKVVAYGQYSEIQLGASERKELHVHRQGGIAGIVEAGAIVPYHEAPRVAAVGSVGQNAGVDSIDVLHRAEVKSHFPSVVHRVAGQPLFFEPADDLEVGDDFGVVLFADAFGVGNVIAMAVRDQQVIGFDAMDIDAFGQLIGGDKGVEQEVFSFHFNGKGRMAVVRQFHICLVFYEKESSFWFGGLNIGNLEAIS